jgi:hypothetical protein
VGPGEERRGEERRGEEAKNTEALLHIIVNAGRLK